MGSKINMEIRRRLLLIVPVGIEIKNIQILCYCCFLLIVPVGIEINNKGRNLFDKETFNRTSRN